MENFRKEIYKDYVLRSLHEQDNILHSIKKRTPYFDKIIKNHLPRNKDIKILDLGCGYGAFLYALSQFNYKNLTGVDASPSQVSELKKSFEFEVYQDDVMNFLKQAPINSYDVIIMFDLIEHLSKVEILYVLKLCYSTLKKGGTLLIHAPNACSPFFGKNFYEDITHETPLTPLSIAQILRASSFSEIQSYEESPVPHGLKSLIRLVLWKIYTWILHFVLAFETGSWNTKNIWSQNFLCVCIKK